MSQKIKKEINFELYQVFMYNFLCQNGKMSIKIFELYQVLVYNFLWQNVSIPPNCLLLMQSKRSAL